MLIALIAQALGEYGALVTVMEAIHEAWTTGGDFARSVDGTTWAGGLFSAFLVWYVVSRRR